MNFIQQFEGDALAFFKQVEKDAEAAWNGFIGGLEYVAKEAEILKNAVIKADPAIQTQVQSLLQLGEVAAANIAAQGNPAIAGLITGAVDEAEQIGANLIQGALGNSAAASADKALVASGINTLGTIASSAATLGYTRAVAAIVGAVQTGAVQGDAASGGGDAPKAQAAAVVD